MDRSSYNQQSWVEEQLAEFEEMAFLANDQIDVPDVRSSLEKLWVRNEQRYQQALAQVGILPENPLLIFPADVWFGEPAVGEILRELWTHYDQALWSERGREVEAIENAPKNRSSQERARMMKLRQDLQPYCTRLIGLEIYFVNYCTPATYLASPKSAVLSTANGLPESEAFHECVLRVAEGLVVANGSL